MIPYSFIKGNSSGVPVHNALNAVLVEILCPSAPVGMYVRCSQQTGQISLHYLKVCTYFALFLSVVGFAIFVFPMPRSRLRLLMQIRMGSQSSPVEEGGLARLAIPWHLCRCILCGDRALGDERHFVFQCRYLWDFRWGLICCQLSRAAICACLTRHGRSPQACV